MARADLFFGLLAAPDWVKGFAVGSMVTGMIFWLVEVLR